MVPPNYAEKRSALAKQIGLGCKGEEATEAGAPVPADVPETQYLPERKRSRKKG